MVSTLGAMVFGWNGKRRILTCCYGVAMSKMMYDSMIAYYQSKVFPVSNHKILRRMCWRKSVNFPSDGPGTLIATWSNRCGL